jgi:hypothetical protein
LHLSVRTERKMRLNIPYLTNGGMAIFGYEYGCSARGHMNDQAPDDGQGVGVVLKVRQHVHDGVPDLPVHRFPTPVDRTLFRLRTTQK